ncbi:MAG: ExeM/NucH family extracellular endonuclease [Gammaproteobacteria bacterium]|nr:ExeM/NucH family extracellular endonuclease [Gammaproteobacteria bacterium]
MKKLLTIVFLCVLLPSFAQAELLINELDYDQPSTDTAEFIELFNSGNTTLQLSDYHIALLNGNDGASYRVINLPTHTLPANSYFVLCTNPSITPNCDLDLNPNSNLIQNGQSDGIQLFKNLTLVDQWLYEVPTPITLSVGLATMLSDSTTVEQSLVKGTNGKLQTACLTPGKENDCSVSNNPGLDEKCGGPITNIHHIQGDGFVSPKLYEWVATEGVVTRVENLSASTQGFFVQNENSGWDNDEKSSEALYIVGSTNERIPGEKVRVVGVVGERDYLTVLQQVSSIRSCGSEPKIDTSARSLPDDLSQETLESMESMLVFSNQPIPVVDNNRFHTSQVLSVSNSLSYQATQLEPPPQTQREIPSFLVNLKDYSSTFSDSSIRVGNQLSNLSGNLIQRLNDYSLLPDASPSVIQSNPRPQEPLRPSQIDLRIASFNLENYFTADSGGGFETSRGAKTATEFTLQTEKLVNAILGLDADIIGLMELGDNPQAATLAIEQLKDSLNEKGSAQKQYTSIFISSKNSDIAVGMLYRASIVSTVGSPLQHTVYPFETLSREPMAQLFRHETTGHTMWVIANHFKSRRCSFAEGEDADQSDGQSCWNAARLASSIALNNWIKEELNPLDQYPALLLGDLNAHAKEDPIQYLHNKNYTDLLSRYIGPSAYTYSFNFQRAYLDHLLANELFVQYVHSVGIWHINVDEPSALGYKKLSQKEGALSVQERGYTRSSDHDPIYVDLQFNVSTSRKGGSAQGSSQPSFAALSLITLFLLLVLFRVRSRKRVLTN